MVGHFPLGGAEERSFVQDFSQSLIRVLDASAFESETAWPSRLVALAIAKDTSLELFLEVLESLPDAEPAVAPNHEEFGVMLEAMLAAASTCSRWPPRSDGPRRDPPRRSRRPRVTSRNNGLIRHPVAPGSPESREMAARPGAVKSWKGRDVVKRVIAGGAAALEISPSMHQPSMPSRSRSAPSCRR